MWQPVVIVLGIFLSTWSLGPVFKIGQNVVLKWCLFYANPIHIVMLVILSIAVNMDFSESLSI